MDRFKRLNVRDVYGEKGLLNGFLVPEHPCKRVTRRLARRRLRREDRRRFRNA